MAFLIILFEGKTSKAVSRTFFCKRPCTRTTYDVQQMPVIESDDFYIGLNFELSVDLTWNRFSSSIWDVITGFGGSVSIVLSPPLPTWLFQYSYEACLGEQRSHLVVDPNACCPNLPGVSFNSHIFSRIVQLI